jgi:hypothetical protein
VQTWDEGTTKDRVADRDREWGKGWRGEEMKGWGEGRPKMVDVIAMPAVVAIATTHSRTTAPAHEGGGSSLPPLPL